MPVRLGTFGRWVIEGVQPDDIATLVAPRLAEPSEVGPAIAKMVGEDEPLKLSAAKVLEVDRPNCPSYFHLNPFAFRLTGNPLWFNRRKLIAPSV